jgi:hypothetical protein
VNSPLKRSEKGKRRNGLISEIFHLFKGSHICEQKA